MDQRKAAKSLCKYLVDHGFEYAKKMTKFTKVYKGMEIEESYDHSDLEERRHIVEDESMFCSPQQDLIDIAIVAYSEKPRKSCSLFNNLWSALLAGCCFLDRLNATRRTFLYVPAPAFT